MLRRYSRFRWPPGDRQEASDVNPHSQRPARISATTSRTEATTACGWSEAMRWLLPGTMLQAPRNELRAKRCCSPTHSLSKDAIRFEKVLNLEVWQAGIHRVARE